MAFKIYLCGHGSWNPNDAYVSVPKNCEVQFYGHFAKTVVSTDTEKLVQGLITIDPHAIHKQYMNCPNMTLSPTSPSIITKKFEAFEKNPDKNNQLLYFTAQKTNLGQLFDPESLFMEDLRALAGTHKNVELVWSCCRSVTLNSHQAMSDEIGWNAIDRFSKGVFTTRFKSRGKAGTHHNVNRTGGHLWVRGNDMGTGTTSTIDANVPYGRGLSAIP